MSVIEEKKALRTYIRQTERTLDPAYKAESSEAICRCVLALEEYRAAGTVFAFAGTVHEIDTALMHPDVLNAIVSGSGSTSFAICVDESGAQRFARDIAPVCDWVRVGHVPPFIA